MRDLAPDIIRQRLLVEGFYTDEVEAPRVTDYLRGVADYLDLRAYGEPTVHSPASFSSPNQGFDAFLPLIDSGISLYVWSARQFFSVILYSCRHFDRDCAVSFTRDCFGSEEIVYRSF